MSNLPKLIGIHGKAQSGKDTVADFLVSTYKDTFSESFAGPLKDAAASAFGIYRGYFDDTEHKKKVIPFWGVSPREIAQFVGTEMFRETIVKLIPIVADYFWIKRLAARLTNEFIPDGEGDYLPEHTVVIPDVRFQNEYDWILSNGGIIIHLTRQGADGIVGIPNHPSENDLTFHTPERNYACENNGTLSDLYRKIADIIMSTKY